MLPKIRDLVTSMRPRQWVKNVFLFAGLIFSESLFNASLLGRVCIGFLLFSLAASSVYIFNDIKDLETDKKHPEKSKRPLAAGKLKVSDAYIVSIILFIIGLAGAFLLDISFFVILIVYVILNLIYSFKLKQMVILDIMVIAFGFVLRVLAGTALAGVAPSSWLIICTMTVSLFLGFSKRRQELILSGSNSNNQRKVLQYYSIPFLDQMIAVVTACTVISYALYTISPETVTRFGSKNLIFTIPFVLYGIFRYLYLIYHKVSGENPTDIVVKDFPFILNVILWVGAVIVIIY
jgi:4-hydroxybenzoate polyprenyltransferase